MAYTIKNTDGTTLILLANGTINQSATSLTLIGKDYNNFGEFFNNNQIKLLANSANDTPPTTPLKGELWYDTVNKKLNVYDSGFKSVSGATIATVKPANLAKGDLWWDSGNNQLNVYDGNTIFNVGPAFSTTIGSNGWVLPPVTVLDTLGNSQQVTLMRNYGDTIGYITSRQFLINTATNYTYLTSGTTTSTVKGLTILGDIQASGKISNNYLTISVDMEILAPSKADLLPTPAFISIPANNAYADVQNGIISNFLSAVFPINLTSDNINNPYNAQLSEVGVPVRSQVRVVCSSRVANGSYYQIRLFEAGSVAGIGQWNAPVISAGTFTNIVAEFLGQ